MTTKAVIIEKEMAVTHSDFFRSLPNALNGEKCSIEGSLVRIYSTAGTCTIELGPEGRREIALLSLPKTLVKMKFENFSKKERQKALERFDRAFQRAGG